MTVLALQRWLLRSNIPGRTLVSAWLTWLTYVLCGSEIAPTAQVPRSVRFPHPTGIVIGDGVVLGDRVVIYQNVTLGSHGRPDLPAAYPQIGDDVKIFAGAVIVGAVKIGACAVIGANVVVSFDVPANAVVLAPRPNLVGRALDPSD